MLIREITEQLFRRGNRVYFSSQHADDARVERRIDDQKFENAITNMERNSGWMQLLDTAPDNYGMPVFDPKSNLTLVMMKKPGSDLNHPDTPQAYIIKTAWHGSNKSCNTPKLAKKNKFAFSRSDLPTSRDFYHLDKGYQKT